VPPQGSSRIFRNFLHLVEEYQPETWSLRGAHIVEPISQGDYDGLCSLYAIINAIRLVVAPGTELSDDQGKALFKAGISFLAKQGEVPKAVHSGIGEATWPQLAQHVTRQAAELRVSVLLEQPLANEHMSAALIARTIEQLITAGKAPVLFMRGKYRHYSVISGYSPFSFKLFDSFGYRWVRRSSEVPLKHFSGNGGLLSTARSEACSETIAPSLHA
jgi:hypothetical protein